MTSPPPPVLVLPSVPPGHHLHQMPDDMHAPHLRAGEWAVIDPADRQVVPDGLYLIEQKRGPIVWQVCAEPDRWRAYRRDPDRLCWYLRAMNSPRNAEECREWFRTGRTVYTSDGTIYADCLTVLGKVVGILEGRTVPPACRLPPPMLWRPVP